MDGDQLGDTTRAQVELQNERQNLIDAETSTHTTNYILAELLDLPRDQVPALLEAYEETPLVARIAGYVQKINLDANKNPFDINSPIKGPKKDEKGKVIFAGDVLAEPVDQVPAAAVWFGGLAQQLPLTPLRTRANARRRTGPVAAIRKLSS